MSSDEVTVPADGGTYDITATALMTPLGDGRAVMRLVDADSGAVVAQSVNADWEPLSVHYRTTRPGTYRLELFGARGSSPENQPLRARRIDFDPIPDPGGILDAFLRDS